MNWEVILSIIAITISVLSLLFFSLYPGFKKYLIKSTFIRIQKFYDLYSIMNPCLRDKIDEFEKIFHHLSCQSLFEYGFPRWKNFCQSEKNFYNFDPLLFQSIILTENFSLIEIKRFYFFWKFAFKKIKFIAETIDKHYQNFIMEKSNDNRLIYGNSSIAQVEETSISFCPTFDRIKLFGVSMVLSVVEKKQISITKIFSCSFLPKKFISELKTTDFCINVKFVKFPKINSKTSDETTDLNCDYSYSLIFSNGMIKDIETFFLKNRLLLNEDIKNHILKHKDWFKATFNIDLKEKIEEYYNWVNMTKIS